MSKSARVTQADIARAIRAAKQTGAGSVRILLDGSICIDPYPVTTSVQTEELASSWDDVSKWEDKPPEPRRRIGDRLAGRIDSSDPLAVAFDRWQRGEINMDELPPGRYANGMRVYADGEWEAIIRSKPLGKREASALEAYFKADGANGRYCGGYDTNCRLLARGFIESSTGKEDHQAFRITIAGKVEWQKHVGLLATCPPPPRTNQRCPNDADDDDEVVL